VLHANPQAPAFLVSIAGEGSEAAAVRTWVEEKGLSDFVRIQGLLEGERRLAALEQAHIFVLPSHTEGLPNAMIEAMAAGLPVVVTPVGSIPDVVVDGTNGLLVRPRDSAALAAALLSLLDSTELRRQLGQAAHTTARSRFETERAAQALSSVVEEIAQHATVSKPRAAVPDRHRDRHRE